MTGGLRNSPSFALEEVGSVIPFNRPYLTGREFAYMAEAHAHGMLAGDGPFTRRCHERLEALLINEPSARPL